MSNPDYPVLIPKNTWEKVAESVTVGQIRRKNIQPKYLQTYRIAGGAAPTLKEEGVPMFDEFPNREPIESFYPIDVYVYCINYDGELRIDI